MLKTPVEHCNGHVKHMLNVRGETLENRGGNQQGHLFLMQVVILQSFTHLFLIHLHWISALCAIIFLGESVCVWLNRKNQACIDLHNIASEITLCLKSHAYRNFLE